MKLIEVQATKEFASTFLPDIFFKMAVNSVLDNAPGFELVHCKDCKHYEIHKPKVLQNCERNGYLIPMKPDDYCSYGERKTE